MSRRGTDRGRCIALGAGVYHPEKRQQSLGEKKRVAARRGVLEYSADNGLGCISAESVGMNNQGLAGAPVSLLTPSQMDVLARLEAQRAHDAGRRG